MKEKIRKEVLEKREQLSTELWRKMSEEALERLFASQWYQKAPRIFTFVSMGKEVDTYSLIARAWQDGKQVAVPIAKKKEEMYFVPLTDLSQLSPSSFGVMEPNRSRREEVVPNESDLFLVPGAVFDGVGNRYGYGGGYYDRYFMEHTRFLKIALGFSFQVMEKPLAVEAHDIAVDIIITENGIKGGMEK